MELISKVRWRVWRCSSTSNVLQSSNSIGPPVCQLRCSHWNHNLSACQGIGLTAKRKMPARSLYPNINMQSKPFSNFQSILSLNYNSFTIVKLPGWGLWSEHLVLINYKTVKSRDHKSILVSRPLPPSDTHEWPLNFNNTLKASRRIIRSHNWLTVQLNQTERTQNLFICWSTESWTPWYGSMPRRPPYSTSCPVMFAIYQLYAVIDFEAC